MKILMIEDGQQLADSMLEYLQKDGYQCEPAITVDEATERVMLHDYRWRWG